MKYYVNIYALSPRNQAHREMIEEIYQKYSDILINTNEGKADFKAIIRHKVSEINSKYPTCKEVKCEESGNYMQIGDLMQIRIVNISGEFDPKNE